MEKPFRLYVWPEMYWGYGYYAVFALASSVEEARHLIAKEAQGIEGHLAKEPTVIDGPQGFVIGGGTD